MFGGQNRYDLAPINWSPKRCRRCPCGGRGSSCQMSLANHAYSIDGKAYTDGLFVDWDYLFSKKLPQEIIPGVNPQQGGKHQG